MLGSWYHSHVTRHSDGPPPGCSGGVGRWKWELMMNCLLAGWSPPADSAIARREAAFARASYDTMAVYSTWADLGSGRLDLEHVLDSGHHSYPWRTATLRRLVDQPDGQTAWELKTDALRCLLAAFNQVMNRYRRTHKHLADAREAEHILKCSMELPLTLVDEPAPELPLNLASSGPTLTVDGNRRCECPAGFRFRRGAKQCGRCGGVR